MKKDGLWLYFLHTFTNRPTFGLLADHFHQKLAEYTHVEAELDIITFDDLLDHLEHMICRVIDLVLKDPSADEYI